MQHLIVFFLLFAGCSLAETQETQAVLDFTYPVYTPGLYGNNLQLNLGAIYQFNNVVGRFSFTFLAQNQPNRNAKYQVLVLDANNFGYWNYTGSGYSCMNYQNCGIISSSPISGQIDGTTSAPSTFYMVVLNKNFISVANIYVKWQINWGFTEEADAQATETQQLPTN